MDQDTQRIPAPAPAGAPSFMARNSGVIAMLGSMFMWGSLPLYWDAIRGVPPLVILSHRMFWSFLFIIPFLILMGSWKETLAVFRSWRTVRILILTSLTLACNWLIYIWAVLDGRVLETSLGYYILPLLNVCAGIFLFRDKPRRAQWIAIALAAVGVGCQVVLVGYLPWVAFSLGITFCLYGLLRKVAPVEALPGLAVETALLALPAFGGVLWGSLQGGVVFLSAATLGRDALLIGTGLVTSVPLIWFAYGVRRLPLVTVGLLQYLSPSLTFIIGVFILREPFTFAHGLSFAFIWAALALYTLDGLRASPRA